MSWRGQGGRRAKGRRGEQDPEQDNTAWLAELEREAAQADDDEDDWASTLRGRRSSVPPPGPDPPPAGEPSWAPDPGPPDRRYLGMDPEPPTSSSWSADPAPQPPPPTSSPTSGSDWSSWRPPDPGAYGGPPPAREEFDPGPGAGTGSGWGDPADGGWQPAGADTPTGAWSPVPPPAPDPLAQDPLGQAGHEPDYPALFGELYRRSAAQQDPVWEAPPAAEPLPEPGPTEPASAAWPFEETTQSWEPSDRSFVWPSDELPTTPADTSAEWERPSAAPWDDPAPQAPPPPPAPPLDQTAAWTSPWASRPGEGNGMAAPPAATGPPPDDWAAAIPTDVPAARRAADPSATRMWQPDADAEPGVPLGPPGADPAARASRFPAPTGAADYEPRAADAWAPAGADEALDAGSWAGRVPPAAAEYEDEDEPWPEARGRRQPGERRARAWPRVVAIISWIVLLMVFCWYYVFPWLERVLPENF